MLIKWLLHKWRVYRYEKTEYFKSTGVKYEDVKKSTGASGESKIFNDLAKNFEDAKLLTNLYIPKEDDPSKTTEIDLVMITRYGIFVIESKDYSGWIFGNEKDKYWIQALPSHKKSKKYRFYNPIWQNTNHIDYLRILIDQIINGVPLYSYIVFSDRCILKSVDYEKNGSVSIVYEDRLIRELKKHIENLEPKLNLNIVAFLYDELRFFSHHDKEIRERHIDSIRM